MKTLYYPAQQGKQAELCRTLATEILSYIRDPETMKIRDEYRDGFTAAALRASGITIPVGAMNVLETRGWIKRTSMVPRPRTPANVWVLSPAAIRFLDQFHAPPSLQGGATA